MPNVFVGYTLGCMAEVLIPDQRTEHRTAFLAEIIGGKARLAAVLGVNRSQPTKWSKGQERPSPEHARLMIDLEHVLDRALLLWAPSVAVSWLQGNNSYLDGARPIEVLRTRGASDVLDALDAAEAGAIG